MIDQWAQQILQDIYHATEDRRIEIIKENLLKAKQMGYLDGATNDWWKSQEVTMDIIKDAVKELTK